MKQGGPSHSVIVQTKKLWHNLELLFCYFVILHIIHFKFARYVRSSCDGENIREFKKGLVVEEFRSR